MPTFFVKRLSYRSQKQFVINERSRTIDYSSHFAKFTPGIKGASAGVGVPCIQPDCLAWPTSGHDLGMLEYLSPKALSLQVRMNGHVNQVQSFLHGGEISSVNGPG